MQCEGKERASCLWLSLHRFGVQRQNAGPSARSIEEGAQLLIALAMALQLAVLQLDKGRSRSFSCKSNLDFTRLGHVRVELPFRLIVSRTNMPRKDDAVRRLPRQHGAPVAQVAFGVSLVPAAADTRLHENRLEGSFSDVMRRGPPSFHLFHEDAERALDGRLYAHGLTYYGFCDLDWHFVCHDVCHVSLPLVLVPPSLERRSERWSTSGQSERV